ncbi:MAG: alpha/beta hydrolase [Actinobacteria bacterium]|nr:alpha/beta hydrolase [Actinomycetota bacterium]
MQTGRISLDSGGLCLAGVLATPAEPTGTLVVLCHGIPLSRPDPDDGGYPLLARQICEKGYASLFVNLRGTGDSGGNFHIGGWYSDLETVVRFSQEKLAAEFENTFLAGFSAGGALAIRYAAEHGGVQGIAAFAAPAQLSEIFPEEHLFAFLELARDIGIIRDTDFPPSLEGFYSEIRESEAIDFISGVSPIPLLLVHGEEDELVPVDEARRLFEAAGEPKELVLLPGGEHRLRHDPRSVRCLLEWLGCLTGRAQRDFSSL